MCIYLTLQIVLQITNTLIGFYNIKLYHLNSERIKEEKSDLFTEAFFIN